VAVPARTRVKLRAAQADLVKGGEDLDGVEGERLGVTLIRMRDGSTSAEPEEETPTDVVLSSMARSASCRFNQEESWQPIPRFR